MNDTSIDIEARVDRMMAAKTPEERIRMASSMFDAARKLVEAGLRDQYGEMSEAQMRARVFERMYGEDFSEEEIRKIAGKIPNMQLD
jgi:hypothetical protein